MVEVIGVRFRTAGKIYFFNPKEFQVKSGDHVIVETARGIEFGSVVSEHPSSHVLLILLFSFFIAYSFVPVCQFPDFIFHLNH